MERKFDEGSAVEDDILHGSFSDEGINVSISGGSCKFEIETSKTEDHTEISASRKYPLKFGWLGSSEEEFGWLGSSEEEVAPGEIEVGMQDMAVVLNASTELAKVVSASWLKKLKVSSSLLLFRPRG